MKDQSCHFAFPSKANLQCVPEILVHLVKLTNTVFQLNFYTANKSRRSTAELLQFTIDSSDPLRSVSILTAADRCAPYSGNICCVEGQQMATEG